MTLTKEDKGTIIQEHARSAGDTGSTEVQIAVLSRRISDLTEHLTTLFPPVRPRGWLELRMIDALPDEWWPVAVAVAAALLDDPAAAAGATRATEPVRNQWFTAARAALHDRNR